MPRDQQSSKKLIRLLQDQDWVPKDKSVKFRRLYPGHWQRSSGAWSWIIEWSGGDIGSCSTVKECLKSGSFEMDNHGGLTPLVERSSRVTKRKGGSRLTNETPPSSAGDRNPTKSGRPPNLTYNEFK